MTPLDDFLDMTCTEIERRASQLEDVPGVLHQGGAAFRIALEGSSPRPMAKTTVGVTRHLAAIGESPIARAVLAAAAELSWIASPRITDGGRTVALAPINDVRELGSLVCGLILLAPGAVYPEHSHPPQEIYLPIAGDGQWRYGGDPSFRTLSENALVYNNPGDIHSVVAQDAPLLALYILWP